MAQSLALPRGQCSPNSPPGPAPPLPPPAALAVNRSARQALHHLKVLSLLLLDPTATPLSVCWPPESPITE